MSRATFEMNLKDAAIRLLPKLNEFIESRKTTESFAVTIEQIARWAGLTRRNGRIDDNQAFHMMQLAQCPVSRPASTGCAAGMRARPCRRWPGGPLVGLGGGLMARTNPSLAEALSLGLLRMTRPNCWRLQAVHQRLADEQHTGLPDSMRVLKVLHLRNDIELAALGGDWPAMGVRRLGGAWTLDARQFDLWAQGR